MFHQSLQAEQGQARRVLDLAQLTDERHSFHIQSAISLADMSAAMTDRLSFV